MKFVFLSLAVLVASVTAWPAAKQTDVDLKTQRIIDDVLVALIEALSQRIIEAGYDPYYLESASGTYTLPGADFFSASGSVQAVEMKGLSGIEVNHISYNIFTGALFFDISLSEFTGSVGAANGEVSLFTRTWSGEGSGSIVVTRLGFSGGATVRIGTAGVTVDRIQIVLTVDGIESNIYLNLFGYDLSDPINNFLSNTLVAALETHKEPISGLLGLIAQRLIDRFL